MCNNCNMCNNRRSLCLLKRKKILMGDDNGAVEGGVHLHTVEYYIIILVWSKIILTILKQNVKADILEIKFIVWFFFFKNIYLFKRLTESKRRWKRIFHFFGSLFKFPEWPQLKYWRRKRISQEKQDRIKRNFGIRGLHYWIPLNT